jgi:hypothetical protein
MQGGNDAYNARQVQKRASASIDELLAEFARNRQATIEAVRDAEPDLWDVRIESAGGLRGPLARVLWLASIEHVNQHVRDLLSQDVPRTPVVTELSSADDSGT